MQETDGCEKCTVKQGGPDSEKTKTVCFPSSVDLALYSVCVYMQASINVSKVQKPGKETKSEEEGWGGAQVPTGHERGKQCASAATSRVQQQGVEEVGKEEDPQMHLAQQHHNGVYLKIKTLKISETGHGGTYL